MARNLLGEAHIHPAIRDTISRYHEEIVREVQVAVAENEFVVVGMKHNPHVKRARGLLEAAGLAYQYIGYGSYLSHWHRRLALKMWTGWPTFPMVFVKGVLVGGADDLKRLLAKGEIARRR
jgi:monothiol glutaredoxin